MTLHLQGEGGAQIRHAPGTVSLQITQAPSGHLMIPCCEFMDASLEARMGGMELEELELHAADHSDMETE